MSLTPEAYQQRLWGVLEELCSVLADRDLPGVYGFRSSADIGVRTQVGFSAELSLLLVAYTDEIKEHARKNPERCHQLYQELGHASDSFKQISTLFNTASSDAALLAEDIRDIGA